MSDQNDSSEAKKVYNMVTDTVTGPNVRLKDNLYQAAFISMSLLAGIVAGVLLAEDRFTGALIGAVAGLIGGLLLSGMFLMIYRALRH